MHTYIRAGLVGTLLASAVWLVSCESSRSPARPTGADTSRAQSFVVEPPSAPAVVSWQCIAAGVGWQSAECQSQRASSVRLAPRVVAALTAPGSPTNLSGSVSSSRVTLSWQAPTGGDAPTSYVVEAGSASGLIDLANFDTGTNAPGLIADNVPAGTYFIRVRAKNSAGVSAPSNELVLIVLGTSGCPPGAPTDFVATASGFTATLRWTPPASACAPTGYIVEAGSTPGASNLANFNTGTTATTYVAGGVGAGTYYVRVRATNSAGTSAPSNEATLVVGGGGCSGPPGVPSLLTGSVSGSTVSLAWVNASDATSYIVEAGTAPGLTNITVSDVGQATTLTATASNGTYYVRVRAKNACGTSAPSNEIVLTVGTAAPTQCAFTVTPTTQSIANSGGTSSVTVTAVAGCAWSATSNASFITITSGANGSGGGTVNYSVAANTTGSPRTGTLTVAGQTVTVSQGAPAAQCTFTLSPTATNFDATGGNATITVTASAPTCTWTAQSLAGWIFLTGATAGTGSGAVTIATQANGGARRSDGVVIGGQTATIGEDAPLPPLTRNAGCGSGGRGLTADTTVQFINTSSNTITITQPDTGAVRSLAPNNGYNEATKVDTVYVVTSGGNCIGNYVAASGGRSAVVQ